MNFFKKWWQKHISKSSAPSSEDEAYVTDSKKALLTRSTPFAHAVLIITVILIGSALIWAYFGSIEEATIGEGKVIPSGQIKAIQSLDGGIVAAILVKEGDMVKKDQKLIELDNTRYKADYAQAFEKYLALSAMVARFDAEANNEDKLVFPKALATHPELMQREINLFNARKQALKEQINLLQSSYDLANQEIKMYEPLLAKGYVSKIEHIRSLRAANEIKIQMQTQLNKFREEALTELNTRRADLAITIEQLNTLKDKMIRTDILSPVNGIVKKLYVVTVGGVIKPGDVIMEIVPLEETLLVEAKILPQDIGFIKVGQPVIVKISAYDFSVYGGLPGKVEYISADAIVDDSGSAGAKKLNLFLINVRTDKNYISKGDRKYQNIKPNQCAKHL